MSSVRIVVAAALATALLGERAFAQSLWGKPGTSRRGSIADHSALEIGDLVTVVVSEAQTLQDNGKLETNKSSALDSKLEVFDIHPETFGTLPAVKYSSSRNVDGETKYSQQGRFETRLSAVVLDVKPNGALLIEGRRTIHLDGDVKEMRVRGLVRPVDIGSDNVVSSDRIADADILYDSEGGRSNVVHKNWFEKLLDVLWPF
ncbi:MAG TPA: flagellar basal body L-ring protein FlgH [Planctomycetota bacterium]|jgi:flagellar L-ring protein precursor FlgH|nr:flagellar basal body L-ring protein FlgH [Planctomycetota bacterium]